MVLQLHYSLWHRWGSHFGPVLRSLKNSSQYYSALMKYLELSRKGEVDTETDERAEALCLCEVGTISSAELPAP